MSAAQPLLHSALEVLPEAIIVTDGAQVIRFINTAAGHLLNVVDKDVVDTPFANLPGGRTIRGPEEIAQYLNKMQPYMARWGITLPEPQPYEDTWQSMIDEHHYLEFWTRPIKDGTDSLIGIAVRVKEVWREMLAEQTLISFCAEMWSPITHILGYADLLLLGKFGVLTEEQQKAVQIIKNKVASLSKLRGEVVQIMRHQAAGEASLQSDLSNSS